MYATREAIEDMYEQENLVHLYQLKRHQFLFLYRLSEGFHISRIAEELDKTERALYVWRKCLIKQFKVKTFEQVMFLFGKVVG